MFGRDLNGKPIPKGWKIKRQDIIDLKGEEFLDLLPGPENNGKRKIIGPVPWAEDGIDAEIIASNLGFSSADEMVTRMAEAIAPETAIEQSVAQELYRRHGNMLLDGSLEERVSEAVHSDLRGQVLERELTILNRQSGKKPVPRQVIRARAVQYIRGLEIRKNITGQFSRQEQAAARAVEKALAKGDVKAAARAKMQQIFNFYLTMESRKAKTATDKAIRNLRKYTRKKVRAAIGKAGSDYLEQIDGLLEQYELKNVSGRGIDRRAAVREWVAAKEADGQPIHAPQEILDNAERINWRELPVDFLLGVNDMVNSIAHAARFKNKLIAGKKERDMAVVRNELLDRIEETVAQKGAKWVLGKADRAFQFINDLKAKFTHVSSWLAQMDGAEHGPWAQRIGSPIRDAGAARHLRMKLEGEEFQAILRKYGDMKLNKKVYLPELGESITRGQIIAIALNMGNDGNMQALLDDKGRPRRLTDADYLAIVANLSPSDFAFVQDVWDYIGKFWPEIAALERRRTGVAPEKVEARPLMVFANDGTPVALRGGYYPLVYDGDFDASTGWAAMRPGRDAASLEEYAGFSGFGSRATTRRGHTEERKNSAGRSPLWSMDVIGRHVDQVVTDLTMYDALHDVRMLLRDPEIDRAIRSRMGPEIADNLDLWLRDIAVGQTAASDWASKLLSHLRTSMSIGTMGFKASTALVQLTGIMQSSTVVGNIEIAKAMAQYGRHPLDSIQSVREMSDFMRVRSDTVNRDVRDALASLEKNQVGDWAARTAFMPLVTMQMQVDMVTWIGAYNKAQAQGKSQTDAVDYADTIVEKTQGSGLLSSLSAIERGTVSNKVRLSEFVKTWTSFIFYFARKFSLAVEKTKNARILERDKGWGLRVAKLAADYLVLFWFETLVGDLLLQRGLFADDDDDDRSLWGFSLLLLWYGPDTLLAGIPGLRDLASATKGFDPGPASARSIANAATAIVNAKNAAGSLLGGDDEVKWNRLLRSMITAGNLNPWIHYPESQINVALRAMEKASKGEDVDLYDYFITPGH
ncbi:hypothetical protein FACS1894205_3190 [Alphaproteobacteria bacterium]|nr:hypothetical protein FACS1894205_3190 [Alphaproteobacteria bacterium]